ncbi:DivIVA domain-containing protein [uncultured Propionibacterium sp.]|uniref:DivIVA domain-containing protein n=1 Tax=uncultured Propionibacterium sp. TaxID=218066 RepID=UPI002931A667|nr:DivIVA domain-containing protein [uncultured Propionibacterium sp.]
MVWVLGILVVGVVVLGLWAARGRLGQLGPQLPDRPGPDLPDGPVSADDLLSVKFAVVTRGYDMEQVDAVLARLSGQLAAAQDAPTAPARQSEPGARPGAGSISD